MKLLSPGPEPLSPSFSAVSACCERGSLVAFRGDLKRLGLVLLSDLCVRRYVNSSVDMIFADATENLNALIQC